MVTHCTANIFLIDQSAHRYLAGQKGVGAPHVLPAPSGDHVGQVLLHRVLLLLEDVLPVLQLVRLVLVFVLAGG